MYKKRGWSILRKLIVEEVAVMKCIAVIWGSNIETGSDVDPYQFDSDPDPLSVSWKKLDPDLKNTKMFKTFPLVLYMLQKWIIMLCKKLLFMCVFWHKCYFYFQKCDTGDFCRLLCEFHMTLADFLPPGDTMETRHEIEIVGDEKSE